jgi:hypothetical protein
MTTFRHLSATIAALMLPLATLDACSGAFGERIRENVHQSIEAGATPLVSVDNIAGSVRIDGWSKSSVDVVATKYGSDAQELAGMTIDVRRVAAGVAIATRYARATHGGGVRYRISVPADAAVRVNNVAGAVDLAGIGGDVGVSTQAGEITADVGMVAGSRSIDLTATTGAISLTIASGSSATVDASSAVGAFSSDVPGISAERQNLVGAHGSGTIGAGSGRIRLRTTTGAITLRQR